MCPVTDPPAAWRSPIPSSPANLFSSWPVAGTDECLGLSRARGAKGAQAPFTRLDPDGWLVRIGCGRA